MTVTNCKNPSLMVSFDQSMLHVERMHNLTYKYSSCINYQLIFYSFVLIIVGLLTDGVEETVAVYFQEGGLKWTRKEQLSFIGKYLMKHCNTPFHHCRL